MNKTQIVLSIIKDLRLSTSFLLGLIFLLHPITAPIGFLLIFNFFDILGYRDVLEGQGKIYNKQTAAYRIIQALFEYTLLFLIYQIYDIYIFIASKFLHLFALQDLLYYYVCRYKLPTVWSWLYWTPVGWFWSKEKPIPTYVIIIQASLGFILTYISLWNFYRF